ncbi:unnamed protein product [Rotaria sordida]|uniref:Uncharacterized protein n=1 Tax=Rotaria sordida TaxID=392033 RepID=A0A814GN28_9BILA|nr:unnamed protein product [Rotaria sordida]
MDESRAMMETLTVKICGEIQTAEAELAHETYNFDLEYLQRQSNTVSLNKQLFQECLDYLSDKKISIQKALLLNTQLVNTYRRTLYTYYQIKTRLIDAYVEQRLDHLNRESHQNHLQLSQVQETIQSAVDHITKFLVDQVDFETVHREAMLKVHREELQQQQEVPV